MFVYIFLRKEVGEALESATNAVAAVQNMSDRIKTIPNGPAPDDDAELCCLFTLKIPILIMFRKQSNLVYRPQEVLRSSGPA